MFIYGNIEELNREQHNDRLRRIELDRLVRKADTTKTMPCLWHRFYHAVYKSLRKMQPTRERTPLPEQIRSTQVVAKQG